MALRILTLATVATVAYVPAASAECEECAYVGMSPGNHELIPSDGVLVLENRGRVENGAAIDRTTLTVTLEGAPVEGALELASTGTMIWRPAQPFVPGATYDAAIAFENPCVSCGGTIYPVAPFDFTFQVDTEPMMPLSAAEIAVETAVNVYGFYSLQSVVCCDGAVPREVTYWVSGGEVVDLAWDDGTCAATRGDGVLRVSIDLVGLSPATRALVEHRVMPGGPAGDLVPTVGRTFTSRTPVCVGHRLANLATGEVVTLASACHGEDVADQLGNVDVDPTPDLAKCEDTPQTCELTPDLKAWDPTRCEPFGPAPAPADGGGLGSEATACAVDRNAGLLALAGPLLLFAARRRRSRRFA